MSGHARYVVARLTSGDLRKLRAASETALAAEPGVDYGWRVGLAPYVAGMPPKPPHVLIAGGGVAAVEAVAALRALAGPRLRITVLSPVDELVPRPASVASPFGFGPPNPLPLAAVQRHARFELHRGKLARVEPDEHVVIDDVGEPIEYDTLLVAVGARAQPAVPGAITFRGPGDAGAVARAVEDSPRLAFVLPSVSSWALPVYELAILAAAELRSRRRRAGDHGRHA